MATTQDPRPTSRNVLFIYGTALVGAFFVATSTIETIRESLASSRTPEPRSVAAAAVVGGIGVLAAVCLALMAHVFAGRLAGSTGEPRSQQAGDARAAALLEAANAADRRGIVSLFSGPLVSSLVVAVLQVADGGSPPAAGLYYAMTASPIVGSIAMTVFQFWQANRSRNGARSLMGASAHTTLDTAALEIAASCRSSMSTLSQAAERFEAIARKLEAAPASLVPPDKGGTVRSEVTGQSTGGRP
jgi:hypothetical protein